MQDATTLCNADANLGLSGLSTTDWGRLRRSRADARATESCRGGRMTCRMINGHLESGVN